MKKRVADSAINDVLFKEAVTKKELARRAMEKIAMKAAAEKKKEDKEPEKRDIYSDTRDAKLGAGTSADDDMTNWTDEKLKEVVDKKMRGGEGERVKTDIICKHFLDAVEKFKYGWFWECPNGGDKCQYRHCLPVGYVLKRDKVDEAIDSGPTLEEQIEAQRKELTSRTPVTFERLQEWLAAKQAKQAAKEAEELEAAKKQYAKGKAAGVSGRMLFSIDASLFVDDAAAGADRYVREDSDDEEDGDGDGGSGGAKGGGSAGGGASLAAPSGGGYLGSAEPRAAAAVDISEPAYASNYDATAGAGATAAGAPGVDIGDLEGVDESLFLDEDLPDDDELE